MQILVFQHLAVEHPGTFLEFWQDAGHSWTTVALDEGQDIPPLDAFDVLVVMGGPMDVWQEGEIAWLFAEKAAIRRWVLDLRRPCLGICLGHQLLAEVVGGTVGPMVRSEVGLNAIELTPQGRADPLFAGLGSQLEVLQWHGAEVSALPEGAEVLARNTLCAVQAFRWGWMAYGLQFHVEATRTTIADWAAIPAYRASLCAAIGSSSAQQLEATVAAEIDALTAAAKRINDNFFGQISST